MGPDGFHTLPVRQSYPFHQHEVEEDLADDAMPKQMELGDADEEADKFAEIDIQRRSVGFEPLLKVDPPLTCDVVSNEDARDPGCDGREQHQSKYIVCICVPW